MMNKSQIDIFQPELMLGNEQKAGDTSVSQSIANAFVSRCTFLQGDCLELMKGIADNSADLIFADLPYGTTNCSWDIKIPFEPLWKQWNRIAKENAAIILTGQQPFTTDIISSNRKFFRYEIIWEKTQKLGFLDANRKPLRAHENIIIFYRKLPTYNPQKVATQNTTVDRKGTNVLLNEHYGNYNKNKTWKEDGTRYPHSVIKISNWNGALFGDNSKATKHPTQKPVELLDWIIKTYTNEGDTVFDCCMGSGTTGVSSKKNNRHFIGIEKDETFFNLAVSRVTECIG